MATEVSWATERVIGAVAHDHDGCLEALSHLAKGVSHDLNNTLQGIGIGMELVYGCLEKDSAASGYLSLMSSATDRLRNMSERLREFNQFLEYRPTECSLTSIVDQALARVVIAGYEIKHIEKDRIDDYGHVFGDPLQLSAGLSALICNALEASPSSVTVSAKQENFDSLQVAKQGAAVSIRIADQGPGIEEKHIDNIFDPFFSTKEKGRGLGLPLARAVVLKNNGLIRLRTGQRGSEFSLFLPIHPTKPHEA